MQSRGEGGIRDRISEWKKNFKVVLYPAVDRSTSQNYVSFHVVNLSDVFTKIDVEFTLGTIIMKKQGEVVKPGNMTSSYWYHDTTTISQDRVKAQLTDGSLFLTAEIIMIGEREMIGGSYSRQPLTSGEIVTSHTRKIFQAMSNPDLSLMCENGNIPCHRMFLTAASDVFTAMMQNDLIEGRQGWVDMKWCSSIVGKELVKFIYTGEMEEKFVKEEYLRILKFGDMYNIDSMKEVAEQEMLETLNEENMIHRFIEGDLYRA